LRAAEKRTPTGGRRTRVLHEAAFEGIMIHEKGKLLKANDQYFKMFGYNPTSF